MTRQEKINTLESELMDLKDYYEQLDSDVGEDENKSFLGDRYHILGQVLTLIDQLSLRVEVLQLAEKEGWPWYGN